MEHWKTIEGFEAYEVSDLGRVRRRLPGGSKAKVGHLMCPNPVAKGYLAVNLRTGGKPYTKKVHRLVAEAFLPNPLNLPEVNHKGRKTDNRACRLEWRSEAGHKQDIMKREQWGVGVHFYKTKRKWTAYYNPNGKHTYLGLFKTKAKAISARRAAVSTLPEII